MKKFIGLAALVLFSAGAIAQTSPPVSRTSKLDAPTFYQVLIAEIKVREGDSASGFSLVLDAARKLAEPALFERAVEIALQSRSGDAALQAVQAWMRAVPDSRDANRYRLQILIALNRLSETVEPLRFEIDATPMDERAGIILALPRLYARSSDKAQAARAVESALLGAREAASTSTAAWTTIGRMRLLAGDTSGALDAVDRAQQTDPAADAPVLLALEIMRPEQPLAEQLVRRYLSASPLPQVRLAYVRALLRSGRTEEARAQLTHLTRDQPAFVDGWLILGQLQLQEERLQEAQAALERYLSLIENQSAARRADQGAVQAYLALAQISEKQKNFAQAQFWLSKVDRSEEMLAAQSRRASLLARQGKLEEARAMIRAIPERDLGEARLKLTTEVQMLRELGEHQLAYDLLVEAVERFPGDVDFIYDLAMVAEKLKRFEDMEKRLREAIAAKPDHFHAYNALGYSLAERSIRLPEARELIRTALKFAPHDPFIQDSLGWVEFRLGNTLVARRILEEAFAARPDAEIAAHLGEVLWTLGERDQAQAVWSKGRQLNPANETLLETMRRLLEKP